MGFETELWKDFPKCFNIYTIYTKPLELKT